LHQIQSVAALSTLLSGSAVDLERVAAAGHHTCLLDTKEQHMCGAEGHWFSNFEFEFSKKKLNKYSGLLF
jgi:hypothetical protein